MLVTFFRLVRCQLNPLLSMSVGILGHPAVRRIQLLKLVQSITDRLGVSLYVTFAGEGMKDERCSAGLVAFPEVRMRISRRLFRGGGRGLRRAGRILLGCRCRLCAKVSCVSCARP